MSSILILGCVPGRGGIPFPPTGKARLEPPNPSCARGPSARLRRHPTGKVGAAACRSAAQTLQSNLEKLAAHNPRMDARRAILVFYKAGKGSRG